MPGRSSQRWAAVAARLPDDSSQGGAAGRSDRRSSGAQPMPAANRSEKGGSDGPGQTGPPADHQARQPTQAKGSAQASRRAPSERASRAA